MSAQLNSLNELRGSKPPHVRLEFSHGSVGEIAGLYRNMAVTCIEQDVTRVLIIAGDGDRAGEQALRDALTMMVLAGLQPGFRLALVALVPRALSIYRNAQRDFSAAGVNTRLFDSEAEAVRWLES